MAEQTDTACRTVFEWCVNHPGESFEYIFSQDLCGAVSHVTANEPKREYDIDHWYVWRKGVLRAGPFDTADAAKAALILMQEVLA